MTEVAGEDGMQEEEEACAEEELGVDEDDPGLHTPSAPLLLDGSVLHLEALPVAAVAEP